jgi:hypothetical protein
VLFRVFGVAGAIRLNKSWRFTTPRQADFKIEEIRCTFPIVAGR